MRRDIIIKNSSGGMANDQYLRDASKAHILQHYDIFTDPNKLIPHLSAENGDASASTNAIKNFAFDGTTLYGLGTVNNTGVLEPCLFTRTDFTGSSWTADSHSSSPTGAIPSDGSQTDADIPAFAYYRTTGRCYGVRDGRYIWSVLPGSTFNSSDADLTAYATVSNFLHHSKDDILYLGYDNKIASKNGSGSWTVAALTLPANYIVTSLSEYGNYLAIGCRAKGSGKSRVFLWNRDATLTTVDESIDWGEGNLMVLEELEGELIGVSFEGDTVSGAVVAQTRVVFRRYNGAGGAIMFDEFTGYSTSPAIQSTQFKQKYRNRILFAARIPIATTGYTGIWAVGRTATGALAVTMEYGYLNTASPSSRYGFIAIGDILFASYALRPSGSDVMYLDKTDDAKTYTTPAIRESLVNPGMYGRLFQYQYDLRKQLVFAGLSYDPLPSGAQVTLKYRVDGGAWQTIFTEATTGKTVTEKIISGLIGQNIEFREENTGGAVITGLRYKYETLQSNA